VRMAQPGMLCMLVALLAAVFLPDALAAQAEIGMTNLYLSRRYKTVFGLYVGIQLGFYTSQRVIDGLFLQD
jgi:hypothetical protein